MGFGDELRQGGYGGRVSAYYIDYMAAAWRQEPKPQCPWVTVHGNGVPDRSVTVYAPDFPDNVDLARRAGGIPGWESRLVAVLVMGSSLTRLAREKGEEGALQVYRDSLDKVRATCEQNKISTIGLAMPVPGEHFTLANGKRPNIEMARQTGSIAATHLSEWGVPTEFGYMDQIAPTQGDRDPDGAHLSASGYDRVARFLVPRINAMLGIDPSFLHKGTAQ